MVISLRLAICESGLPIVARYAGATISLLPSCLASPSHTLSSQHSALTAWRSSRLPCKSHVLAAAKSRNRTMGMLCKALKSRRLAQADCMTYPAHWPHQPHLCSSVGAGQLADAPVRCRRETLERGLQVGCTDAVLTFRPRSCSNIEGRDQFPCIVQAEGSAVPPGSVTCETHMLHQNVSASFAACAAFSACCRQQSAGQARSTGSDPWAKIR